MIDYVSPLVDERIVKPGNDFISVLADGEKRGSSRAPGAREHVAAGHHETTINLLCNGTCLSSVIRISGKCSKTTRPGQAGYGGMPAVRCPGQVHPAHRLAGRGDARENLAQG